MYFHQILSRKVVTISPSSWSFRKLQDVDWTKQLQGFVPPSPVLFSPVPAAIRMHFCALLVFSNSFIEFKPNILLFWLKNMYFCANLSTEYFLIENEILIVMRPSKIYSIWLWTFCGFCEIPYFMEVKW